MASLLRGAVRVWFSSGLTPRPLLAPSLPPMPLAPPLGARGRKRGTEYQPKNLKRKHTHGFYRRLATRTGIELVLRRMLKGRRSLTH
ncbi:unnamed protein product [Lampetra fluviatilis]